MSGATRCALVIAGLLVLVPSLGGAQGWDRYLDGYHGPYRGRVIDAETKQPLAGAVILAVWRREQTQLFRTATVFYEAREVLTDASGEFVVHAEDIEMNAPLKTWRPTFVIFFPGYGSFPGYETAPRIADFEGAGATVELPRLRARKDRLRVIGGLPPPLVPTEKMPNLIRLMNIEGVNLGLQPIGQ